MQANCDALYKYSPNDGSLRAIEITWTPVLVRKSFANTLVTLRSFSQSSLSQDIEYTVVIDDGEGSTGRERVTASNCDSTQCNYTYYPAVGSRAEFGVSVEVAGCVTTTTACLERPVCELNFC